MANRFVGQGESRDEHLPRQDIDHHPTLSAKPSTCLAKQPRRHEFRISPDVTSYITYLETLIAITRRLSGGRSLTPEAPALRIQK